MCTLNYQDSYLDLDSVFSIITMAASTRKFSVVEMMLPDHLLLRVPVDNANSASPSYSPHELANWPAYKFGIETMLRSYGLEGHIAEDPRTRLIQVSREQWEAEEELCRAIIAFNVKDFTPIFGGSRLSEKSAGDIWTWLSGMHKERVWSGMEKEGESECRFQ